MPYFYCFYSYKAAELQGSANTNPEQTRLRDAFPSNMLVIKRVSYIRIPRGGLGSHSSATCVIDETGIY